MPHILFLTAHDPHEHRYWNNGIIDELAAKGVSSYVACWTDVHILELGTSATHVCLLTAGHYDQHIDSFTALLQTTLPELQRRCPRLRMCNSPALTLWNSSKTYLLDLQAAGFPLPLTVLANEDLQAVLATFDTCVVKPCVGASGKGVVKVEPGSSLEATGAVLVQEFIPDIAQGELSLVYIDGNFIAGVIKKPRDGEFRINSAYGGQVSRLDAVPDVAVAVGVKVVSYLTSRFGRDCCAYMRLDGVVNADNFVLMEIECIEPALTFGDSKLCTEVTDALKSMFERRDHD